MWLCQTDYRSLYIGVVPIERIVASLLCLQTNRIKLSLHLHEVSKWSADMGRNPCQTKCLDLPAGHTASSKTKKPGMYFLSATCVIKRKPSLNHLSVNSVLWRTGRKKCIVLFMASLSLKRNFISFYFSNYRDGNLLIYL